MNLVAMRSFTRFLTNTNSTTYTDADLDASINTYSDLFATEILESMDEWDFKADYATTNLVASQQEYVLPTDILKIKRVEVTYDGTNWYSVAPMDLNEKLSATDSTSVANDFATTEPYFDLMDNSIMLYPIPTAASTAGLKIWYEKLPTTITTSVDPAFVQPFHKGLCYGAAKDYFDKYMEVGTNANKAVNADNNLEKIIQRMKAFYRKRNQDRKYTVEGYVANYGYGLDD